MALRVEDVLARRIQPVYFLLQPRIYIRVREDAEEEASKRARGSVRPCDDREDPVVDELSLWWGTRVGEVFVVLRGRG